MLGSDGVKLGLVPPGYICAYAHTPGNGDTYILTRLSDELNEMVPEMAIISAVLPR